MYKELLEIMKESNQYKICKRCSQCNIKGTSYCRHCARLEIHSTDFDETEDSVRQWCRQEYDFLKVEEGLVEEAADMLQYEV